MTKRDFIAMADAIRGHTEGGPFTYGQLHTLADFCQSQNPNFKRQRWLDYIAGQCGKNGGKL
jgi:hypothetical protein